MGKKEMIKYLCEEILVGEGVIKYDIKLYEQSNRMDIIFGKDVLLAVYRRVAQNLVRKLPIRVYIIIIGNCIVIEYDKS
jgi:hypothetical protein